MKESDAVYAAKRKIIDRYLFYLDNVTSDRNLALQSLNHDKTQEVGIQFDNKKDHLKCNCGLAKNTNRSKSQDHDTLNQIYSREQRSKSSTDTDSTVKPLQKKKVERIYVENGCGTSYPVGSFCSRQRHPKYSPNKKTMSKCVGNCKVKRVVSEKLSPIIKITGSTTSYTLNNRLIEIDKNTFIKNFTSAMTQIAEVLINKVLSKETSSYIRVLQAYKDKRKLAKKNKIISQIKSKVSEEESSDSLLQQIHNLENCNSVEDRQSRCSGDLAENVLEREYRRLFTSKSNGRKKSSKEPVQNKASTLKRGIVALRRSFMKARESTINSVISQMSSRVPASNQRDTPIISDSPFLEAHYYSQIKLYGSDAFPSLIEHDEQKIYEAPSINNHNFISNEEVRSDAQRDIISWDTHYVENRDIQADNGTFDTCYKKFNYEENSPISVVYEENIRKERTEILPPTNDTQKKKKKKFFFFRKKNKNKPFKSKDSVTTGRCEVNNRLLFKTEHINKREQKIRSQSISEVYEDMTKAAWIQKFLSDAIESQRSVKVRWNNKKYKTTSSTAFELIEKIYENTGIFRSKSDVPIDSSYDKLLTKQHQADFVPQNIEAWMIPTNVGDTTKTNSHKIKSALKQSNHEMEITLSGQKWFIEKSKAFSHKIELVLLSKSKFDPKKSSNYLQIDIPKGFFEDSNRGSKDSSSTKAELDTKIPEQPSKEMAYKIIEYDTGNDLKKEVNIRKYDAANNKQNIQLTVNVKRNHTIKPLSLGSDDLTNNIPNVPKTHRNVMSRGSNVSIQKSRGIKNGITGHKDLQKMESPINKIRDCPSGNKCKHEPKKCKHESKKYKHESISLKKYGECIDTFLRNYPRLWTLEEIELFSWCASDCLLRSGSDDSTSAPNQNLHVTQSCPHILNGFGALVSSCDVSIPVDGEFSLDLECENTSSWYSRNQKKCMLIKDQNGVPTFMSCKRVIPKDSIEVYKRRQIIARSDNRCKWYTSNCSGVPPQSVSNNECHSSLKDEKELCWKLTCQKSKANENTSNLKRVLLRDFEEPDYFSEMLIDHNESEVIEPFKSRHAVSCYEVTKKPITENPCGLTQMFDQESSEKVTTLSQSSKSTSFELASNLLSRGTSLSHDEFSSQDCVVCGPPSSPRSSPFKQNPTKPPETTIKLTRTRDESLPTDITLSKITKRPEPSPLPQSLSPSTNTGSAADKTQSKTFLSSDKLLPHIRNSSSVPKSSPSHPYPNSQASLLSTVLSCSSIRSNDDDQYLSKYPSPDPCPPLTIETPRTRTKLFNRDTTDNCHLLQQKHMSVQSPTFNNKIRTNPKKEKNHSAMQCMVSRDIILPFPKPCREHHSRLESRSPYNHHRQTSKMTPQSCQLAGTTDCTCWRPPAPIKHTDSFYLTKETLAAKKNKKDINVKVDNKGRYILLEKQNYRYPCLVPMSKKPSSLPTNLYKHPQCCLQQCCGQRLETELPSESCKIDSDKDDQKEVLENKSEGSTKTIEINFRFKVPNDNKPINMKIVEDNTDKNKVHLIDQILGHSQEVHISNKESILSGTQSDKNDFNISICMKELKCNESEKLVNCCTDQTTAKPKGNDLPAQNRQQSSRNKHHKKALTQPKSSYFKTEESTSRCEIQEILINVKNDDIPLTIPKIDINNCYPKTREKCTCKPGTQHTCEEHQTIKKTVKSHINTKIGETKTLSPEKSDTCKYYTTTRKYEEHISGPGSKVMKKPKTKVTKKPKAEPECKPKPPPTAAQEPKKGTSFMESMYSAANVLISSNYSDSDLNENKMTDKAIYNSLKTNLMKDTNINRYNIRIESNNPRTESNVTLTDILILNEDVNYPTKDNRETNNERTESAYVASDNDALPLNWNCNDILWDVGKKYNCKRNKRNLRSQHTYCDLCSERDSDNSFGSVSYVDVETQNSRFLTSKYTSPNQSMHSYESLNDQNHLKRDGQLQCTDVGLTPLMTQIVSSRGKQRNMKPSKGIRIYNEENIILRNMEAICEPRIKKGIEINVLQEASILQSYATKKAVLEIYNDNIRYKENDRLVAKLPKFAYDAENEVYDAIAANINKYRCPKKMPLR